MTIRDLINKSLFTVINEGSNTSRAIENVFCCDLLSIAMARGIENAAWVTVMGNINSIAVLSLTDMALIILAEGRQMDEPGLAKAKEEGVTVLATEEPVFDAALKIHDLICG